MGFSLTQRPENQGGTRAKANFKLADPGSQSIGVPRVARPSLCLSYGGREKLSSLSFVCCVDHWPRGGLHTSGDYLCACLQLRSSPHTRHSQSHV